MEKPEIGDSFTAKIDDISRSGNGIIYTDDGLINIGPVIPNCEGTEITASMREGIFAKCKTRSVTRSNYDDKFRRLVDPDKPSPKYFNNSAKRGSQKSPVSEKSESTIGELTGRVVEIDIQRTGIGGVPLGELEKTEIHVPGAEVGQKVKVKITQDNGNFALAEILDDTSTTSEDTKEIQSEVSSTEQNKDDVEYLRQKAEKESIDEVPHTDTTPRNTQEYSRSQAIKEYVKTRANGACEGCGDPAPFTSKTGKPYFHAHHIYELSEGGPDSPDSVVALCPNCHYRVHHGEDGAEYNQQLLKTVERLEKRK